MQRQTAPSTGRKVSRTAMIRIDQENVKASLKPVVVWLLCGMPDKIFTNLIKELGLRDVHVLSSRHAAHLA